MPLVKRNVSDLCQNPKNPRVIKDQRFHDLCKSIQDDPKLLDARPIVLNTRSNTIVCGNQRLEAVRKLGWTEVSVYEEDLSDDEAERWMYKDNLHFGEHDFDAIANSGHDLDFLKDVGFLEKELDKIVGRQDHSEDDILSDIQSDLSTEIVVQKGDIWTLGNHRLMCGDSTKDDDVGKLFDGKSADICFTSPPYNLGQNMKLRGYNGQGKKNNAYEEYNDDKTDIEWRDLMLNFTSLSLRFCEYIFVNVQMLAGNKKPLVEWWFQNIEHFCDVMIWDKEHGIPAMSEKTMNSRFEFIFIFGNKNCTRAIATASDWRGSVDNVYVHKRGEQNKVAGIHGATFPIHFPEHIIKTFSRRGMIVYDPFCGSGTTLIACENLQRSCLGMEIDPKYCDVIIKRWEEKTGNKAVKI